MKCSSCGKEKLWLHFIGKDCVCGPCIAKNTVFKEMKTSNDMMLKKAIRTFDINSYQDLKSITQKQFNDLAEGKIKEKEQSTIIFKKNAEANITKDLQDDIDEYDQLW